MKLPVCVLRSRCDCGELRVWCLHAGVTVLGGKVGAPVCEHVGGCEHLMPKPWFLGRLGKASVSHLPLLPRGEGYLGASLWVYSVVTKT